MVDVQYLHLSYYWTLATGCFEIRRILEIQFLVAPPLHLVKRTKAWSDVCSEKTLCIAPDPNRKALSGVLLDPFSNINMSYSKLDIQFDCVAF